jgi:hypothetical protein
MSFATPPATLSSTPIPGNSAAAVPYLLTTGSDGSVKLWQAREAKKSDHGEFSIRILIHSVVPFSFPDDHTTHNLRSSVSFGGGESCSAILTHTYSQIRFHSVEIEADAVSGKTAKKPATTECEFLLFPLAHLNPLRHDSPMMNKLLQAQQSDPKAADTFFFNPLRAIVPT